MQTNKKIVLIKTNVDELHTVEFVKPVERIVQLAGYDYDVISIENIKTITQTNVYAACIICGTALSDFQYLALEKPLQNLPEKMPVLGICAGAQLLLLHFDCRLEQKTKIGMARVVEQNNNLFENVKEAYCLFTKNVRAQNIKNFTLTLTDDQQNPLVFKHNSLPVYAVLFHPEVRNERVVTKFLQQNIE